ncbi:MAG: hypothetical protein QNJ14_11125 [Woeseiaceae bacterium]|nr:hypothetical protein [Woeseiaceae bacterium]
MSRLPTFIALLLPGVAMLGVFVPEHNYFFVSDVHVPRTASSSPREGRQSTECWFARWAVENLASDVRVANSHSPIVTPIARLNEYLQPPSCWSQY